MLESAERLPAWVGLMPLIAAILGLLVAAWMYLLHEGIGARWAKVGGPVYAFLYNKWYVDEVYDFIFVKGAKALGDFFWKKGDQKTIDGLGPNGVSWLAAQFGKGLGLLQSGYIYTYAFVMLIGLAGSAHLLPGRCTGRELIL